MLQDRQVTLSRLRLILRDAAVFLIILLVTLLLQWGSGAHSAALGAEPDEASHYVTGVMIRDYIARGLPGNPVTFAKDFYIHYPRVAFGLWPPLFHLLSGVDAGFRYASNVNFIVTCCIYHCLGVHLLSH